MKGGSRAGIYRHFVFLIAVYIVIGCAPPIGSITDPRSADDIWAVPYHVVYEVGDWFDRDNDLKVFTSYQGLIPIDQVNIGIADDSDYPDDLEYIPKNNPYRLGSAGEKRVVVEYNGMSTMYKIRVGSYSGGGNGTGDGSGGGIQIEWAN